MTKFSIVPEDHKIDSHFLTIIGRGFKWDHAKGLAEWVKNSADAYATTTDAPDGEQFILIRTEIKEPKKDSVFECIDFVGMTAEDIDNAAKIWGKPDASKKGTRKETYGGHGNGGKFYMKEMFETSRFITYRDDALSVFGFDNKGQYGFMKDRRGLLKNRKMELAEALEFARIDDLAISSSIKERWKSHGAGFTVVVGEHPSNFSRSATILGILSKLQSHPQARQLIVHKQIIHLSKGQSWGVRMAPPNLLPMEGFEDIPPVELPDEFTHAGNIVSFGSSKYPKGKLMLRTSAVSLRTNELEALHTIDVRGELRCIASYKVNELGIIRNSRADFIWGELYCPFLEDPDQSHVTNEREKLAENEITLALRAWIAQEVENLADKMAQKHEVEQKHRDLQQSAQFVALLDIWKNKFMSKNSSTIFGGASSGDTFGGDGDSSGGVASERNTETNENPSSKNSKRVINEGNEGNRGGDSSGGTGGGAGTEQRKGSRTPRVLLSGHDLDPLDPNAKNPFNCSERHPPVYQRDQDIPEGIFWINTSKPLAEKILEHYGVNSARWREYLFQRFVDIIFKQQVHLMGKSNPYLTADRIDILMNKVISDVHDQAATDLERYLFDDALKTPGTYYESDQNCEIAENDVALIKR